jgi:hypothetical protein
MIREMLGIAEGVLQDLHNDHGEVDSLMDRIMECDDRAQRAALFEEMKTKLLAHAHAEQEVLYRALEAGRSETSRTLAHEGANEHQIVEGQLQKISATGDNMSGPVDCGAEGAARTRRASCRGRGKYWVQLRARRVRKGRA